MLDVSLAVGALAKTVVLKTRDAGEYDQNGNWIAGAETSQNIQATVQPMRGRQLEDLPEGIRTEAKWLIWSRWDLAVDDHIETGGETYRVMYVWPREEGGFTRGVLGLTS
ncbi:phage head completion protein [Roseibium alexandrii]|uniref:Head-tail adaptor n=1 Tax=Roseibium alexandrii TaxID=388408 RepID=A0A0M6ZWI0_9HYPH|nr:hypothetical protein [Roseibium alexandrii]CTQ67129.1 hypothetical protein LAX5112_01224 [Roseibium alexandrii]